MQHDYHREELLAVHRAGPGNGEDFFRLQVRGAMTSKHINIKPEQLRVIADVVDETNPPTLLHLQNGARVLRAETWFNRDGVGEGYVIADVSNESAHEFVTWHVWRHKGEIRWLAENGDYCSTYELALVSFNERRGVSMGVRN